MKKLLISVYLFVLMLVGYTANASPRYSILHQNSYKTDLIATANVPWMLGALVYEGDCIFWIPKAASVKSGPDCFQVFLGATADSYYLIQEFYISGEKATDPFLVFPFQTVLESPYDTNFYGPIVGWYKSGARRYKTNYKKSGRHGLYILWSKNGNKQEQYSYRSGKRHGPSTHWYLNSKRKYSESYYIDDNRVGIRRQWDWQGNLEEEKDCGYPDE